MSNNGAKSGDDGTRRTKRKYDEEFKREALRMIDGGQTVRLVAQSLAVSENLLHKWKQARGEGASDAEREVSRARLCPELPIPVTL